MSGLRSRPGRALALMTVLVIVAGASYRLSADKQVGVRGHLLIGVSSGAMAPRISAGDLEIERPVSLAQAAKLRPGQIISFRSPIDSNQIMTSRIVAVARAADGGVAYLTKTDANDSPDAGLAPGAAVVGVYQSTIPYGWYLVDALHRPLPLGLLLVLLLVWVLSEPFRRRSREAAEAVHQELAFEVRTPVVVRPSETSYKWWASHSTPWTARYPR